MANYELFVNGSPLFEGWTNPSIAQGRQVLDLIYHIYGILVEPVDSEMTRDVLNNNTGSF